MEFEWSEIWKIHSLTIREKMLMFHNGHQKKEKEMLYRSLVWPTHLQSWVKTTSRNQPKCNHSIYDYMRLVVVCNWIWEYLQLQNQISTILVILTIMMQLLKFSSYWLDRFYIHFHPLIGWYVPLIEVITKLVAS